MSQRLGDVAKVLRSKNAGAFEVTFDIFFHDRASYQAFKRSGILTPELLATLYAGNNVGQSTTTPGTPIRKSTRCWPKRTVPSTPTSEWGSIER